MKCYLDFTVLVKAVGYNAVGQIMDKSGKTYRISLYGIMFGTIIVAMAIDKLISMSLPSGISTAACVLLVTFAFCLIQNDWLTAFCAGAFFGLASLIKAFVFGEVAFIVEAVGNGNALVLLYAVCIYLLPRLFVGIVAFGAYRLAKLLLVNVKTIRLRETLCLTVGVLFGLVTNTALFLTSLNIAKDIFGVTHNTLLGIIKIVVWTNILPEYLISLILAPQVIIGVRRALHLGIEATSSTPTTTTTIDADTEATFSAKTEDTKDKTEGRF